MNKWVGRLISDTYLHKHQSYQQHSALGTAAAAAGLAAAGGARYAQGGPFFPESLTTGPIPTAVRGWVWVGWWVVVYGGLTGRA